MSRFSVRGAAGVAVVVAVAYAVGSLTAFVLFNASEAGAVFFPPAGVTLAALILTRYRTWPWVLGAAGITEFLVDVGEGHDPRYVWGFVLANMAEPLVGAFLVRRAAPDLDLSRWPDLWAFLAGGVLIGPLIGGAIGASTLAWGMGRNWADSFGPFWAGDGLGALVVGGAIVAWQRSGTSWTVPGALRALGWTAVVVAVTAVGFWPNDVPSAYLVIPLMLWFAVHGGVAMVASAGVVLSLTANALTAAGRGPWQGLADSPQVELATLQVYLAFAVLSAWLFAVQIAERDRAQATLRVEQATRARVEARYEVEEQAAHQLQQALLPAVTLEYPGARAAVRYRPAEQNHDIGGDWYDVFGLPGGRVGFSVGDVVGHDMNAAAVSGRLQSVLRVLARTSDGPGHVLSQLDIAALTIPNAEFATVGYGEFSPYDGTLRYACAGHPPPLMVSGQHATYLSGGRSQPLGLANGSRPQAEHLLPAESILLWYSDGLIEDRGATIDHGLRRLAQVAERLTVSTPEGWCDAVLTDMTRDRAITDDIVLICLHLGRSKALDGPLSLRITEPTELAAGRQRLRTWGHEQGIAPPLLETLVLVCNEALTNALEHAYSGGSRRPVDLLVDRSDADGHLRIKVSDSGRWQHDREAGDRGRGLPLINRLAASTTLNLSPTGTTVTILLPTGPDQLMGSPPVTPSTSEVM